MASAAGDFPIFLKWLSYPRAILAAVFGLLLTGSFAIFTVVVFSFYAHRRLADGIVRTWAKILLWVFQIRPQVAGLENLPQEGAIYIFNHSSHLDIPVIVAAIPRSLRFGAKAELFKIPFFGAAMKKMGMLVIERRDREKVLEIYRQNIAKVKEGYCVTLAPEGTRQDGVDLGPFKSGPFYFAIAGGLKIVPIVLRGLPTVLPKHGLLPQWGRWHTKVYLKVLAPHDAVGLTESDRPHFQDRIRESMREAFHGLPHDE